MVLFDLRRENVEWANSVNDALAKDNPKYISRYGKVGSDSWWKYYERGDIPHTTKSGIVSFVGRALNPLSDVEYDDVVEISFSGDVASYSRCGHWDSHLIKEGVLVKVDSFEISVEQKYGPMIFIFDCCVELSST